MKEEPGRTESRHPALASARPGAAPSPGRPAPFALTLVGSAWTAGVLLGAIWPGLEPVVAGWFALGAVACALPLWLAWSDRRLRWAALLLGFFMLGLARCLVALPLDTPEAGSLRTYNLPAEKVTFQLYAPLRVRGVISEGPERINSGTVRFTIGASAVYSGAEWLPAQGSLLALTDPYTSPAPEPGDLVVARGMLQDPPEVEGFDYAAYLLRRGVGSYMAPATIEVLVPDYESGPLTMLGDWRAEAGRRMARQLPEPSAGLLRGIVLGEQRAIARDIRDDFSTTGTAHLLAISGSNITLLMVVVFFLARGALGLWGAVLISLAVVAGYAVFVSFGWPVWRAALMAGFYLLARIAGRPVTWHTLLAAAALFFTALEPLGVLDIGFQLSFAAMVGLIVGAPLVDKLLAGRSIVWRAMALTVGVQLFTDPLLAFYFDYVSLISPLANLLVGPWLLPAMGLGLLQMLAGMLFDPLGQVVAWACWLVLSVMLGLVQLLARVPLAAVELPKGNLLWLVTWYALLAAVLLLLDKRAAEIRAPAP